MIDLDLGRSCSAVRLYLFVPCHSQYEGSCFCLCRLALPSCLLCHDDPRRSFCGACRSVRDSRLRDRSTGAFPDPTALSFGFERDNLDGIFVVQNAGANGFVGSLHKHTERKLGFLHGFYGTLSQQRAFSTSSLVLRWETNVNVHVVPSRRHRCIRSSARSDVLLYCTPLDVSLYYFTRYCRDE